jgi:hypothetical protein
VSGGGNALHAFVTEREDTYKDNRDLEPTPANIASAKELMALLLNCWRLHKSGQTSRVTMG